jgi:hypothetical protein
MGVKPNLDLIALSLDHSLAIIRIRLRCLFSFLTIKKALREFA